MSPFVLFLYKDKCEYLLVQLLSTGLYVCKLSAVLTTAPTCSPEVSASGMCSGMWHAPEQLSEHQQQPSPECRVFWAPPVSVWLWASVPCIWETYNNHIPPRVQRRVRDFDTSLSLLRFDWQLHHFHLQSGSALIMWSPVASLLLVVDALICCSFT